MLSSLAALTLAGTFFTACSAQENTVRIGSYNTRVATGDKDSPVNNWQVRAPRLIRSIMENQFDICGFQEVMGPEQVSIPQMVKEAGGNYDFYFFNPYSPDGIGPKDISNKGSGIMWRKDRFEAGEPHYFWVSDPPEVMQSNDTKFKRGGFCLILKDLQNQGARYFVMVTHAALNKEQRVQNAHVYLDMERKWNPEGLPSFFLGDFNAREKDGSSALYRTWWTDSYLYFDAEPSRRSGPSTTFNGWDLDKDSLDPERRIDYIYFRGKGVKPLRYVCNDTLYDGLYASDHFPIYVDFQVK